ncbi:hypothetical protein KAR91_12650 [Candidatus Pacearchaeota archaeon]|nr:hypothetical protein [Candidatus Pacearchaeota archaeon]
MSDKHPGGRPPFYNTPEELQLKINEYIESVEGTEKKLTITGLAYFLGFESRNSFYAYEKKEGFSYTIKRARLFIESDYEQDLRKSGRTTDIFALKNFGWIDSREITGDKNKPLVHDASDEMKDLIRRIVE